MYKFTGVKIIEKKQNKMTISSQNEINIIQHRTDVLLQNFKVKTPS